VFERRPIAILDLRPSRQAGLDRVPLLIERNGLGRYGNKEWPPRPRADKTHVASQHVPELGQLVEARQADETADARDPLVAITGPDWGGLLRVGGARSKPAH